MIVLADESVDRQIVERLRHDGFEVTSVAEMEPSISDEEVLHRANQRVALLLTADKDFGELVFRERRTTGGVVLIRLAGLSAERKAEIVSEAFGKHSRELSNHFCVISPGTIRIRPLM